MNTTINQHTGAAGAYALAETIRVGAIPLLRELRLYDNRTGGKARAELKRICPATCLCESFKWCTSYDVRAIHAHEHWYTYAVAL